MYSMKHVLRVSLLAVAALALMACEDPDAPEPEEATAQDAWWENLQALCGNAYPGELTKYEEEDDEWLDVDVIMHVRECTPTEIRIPLHVGDNHSRTWVLTRGEDSIELKHDHRYPDGSEEALHWYGGTTEDDGTANRQEFPAGDFSKNLFEEQGIPDSAENTWYMEVHPGEKFVYGLVRFNREFEAEFDLTDPVEPPRAPWAVEPDEDWEPDEDEDDEDDNDEDNDEDS